MKKLLFSSALCLGLTGAITVKAQQGTLYVTDYGAYTSNNIPVSGAGLIEQVAPGGVVTTLVTGLSTPNGIVADGTGNLLFGSTVYNSAAQTVTSSIQSIPLTGGTPTTYSIGGSLLGPSGLAFGPSGVLYNGNAYGNPGANLPPPAPQTNSPFTITKNVGGSGNLVTQSLLLLNPQGLAYGGPNNPFLFSATGNAPANFGILRIDPATGSTSYLAQNTVVAGVTSGTFNNPVGLAVGPDGALYVANNGASDVVRVDATTGATTIYAYNVNNPVTPSPLLVNPEGLTFDSLGNLYVVGDNGYVTLVPNTSLTPTTSLVAGVATEYAYLGNNSFPAYITFVGGSGSGAVPEPSTYAIFGLGGVLLSLTLLRRGRVSLRA